MLLHMGYFAGSVGCGWLQFCGATLWGVSTVKVAARLKSSSNLHSAHTLQRSTKVQQPATSNSTSKITHMQ